MVRAGSCAPRRPLLRCYSPEPQGTSDGRGCGLAASRDPRGLAGSGPRGRGHVARTSAPLAFASVHLSGRPQQMRAPRRGRARRGGRERRGAWPRCAAPRRAPGSPSSSPGPRARPPPSPPARRVPPTPPRALARALPHTARASPGGGGGYGGGGGASSPERGLQGSWRRSLLFCGCFPRWAAGGWEVSAQLPRRAYRSVGP